MEVNNHVWNMNKHRTWKYKSSVKKELGVIADHNLKMSPVSCCCEESKYLAGLYKLKQ